MEVLRAIYGEEAVGTTTGPEGITLRLLVDLRPRVEQGAALVSVCFAVDLPAGYPAAAAPRVSVERSRGLGDAGIRALLAAAERAADAHGCQDFGCVSQVLAEVSEALDETNDACECNICLASCGKDEPAVHTLCGHVYHSTCIGRWATLRAAEAEAAAAEAARSLQAEREALQREVAEAECRGAELAAWLEDTRTRLAECTKNVSAFQARAQRRANGEEEEEDDDSALRLELGANAEEEDEVLTEEEIWRRLQERARALRAEAQRAEAEERRARGRLAEQRRRLAALAEELAGRAARRRAAALPCPVCREPIEHGLLPTAPALATETSDGDASVKALPQALKAQVREVQKQQAAILNARRLRQSNPSLAAAEQTAAEEEGPADASEAGATAQGSHWISRAVAGGAVSSHAPSRAQATGGANATPERPSTSSHGRRMAADEASGGAQAQSRSDAGASQGRRGPDADGGRRRQQRSSAVTAGAEASALPSQNDTGWEGADWSASAGWWQQGAWDRAGAAWSRRAWDAGADAGAARAPPGRGGAGEAPAGGSARGGAARWQHRRRRGEGAP